MIGPWTRRAAVAGLSLAASLALSVPALAWPDRPITLVVPWGAGGGTDATSRIVASLIEKSLGQPVNVVNRTGGNGLVGLQAIATARPDGYTLGMVTTELSMLHWQGLTDLTHEAFTPIALVNTDPAGLQVGIGSPYSKASELLAAIKEKPGALKASGAGQGSIWHLALAGMLQKAGLDTRAVAWVPSNGAAPAMQDLAAGGIDIVTCSVPEARAMLDAKRARSLAVMSNERNPAFPNVPTLKEATGIEWTVASSWRGIAGPKGLPGDVTAKLRTVLKQVYDGAEYKEFMTGRGFGMQWAEGDAFRAFMVEKDEEFGKVMKAAGLAK